MFRKKIPPAKKQLLRGQSLDSHTFQVLLKTGVRHQDNNTDHHVVLTSCSEESEGSDTNEKSQPPASRRGRRDAFCEKENMGEDSPIHSADDNLSPDETDQFVSRSSTIRRRRHRRRSSVHDTLRLASPVKANIQTLNASNKLNQSKILRRNQTIGELSQSPSSPQKTDDTKKSRHAFSLFRLNLMKVKEKDESSAELKELLQSLKRTEFKDAQLVGYKDSNWSDLIVCSDKDEGNYPCVSEPELKRRGAVWELFQSECTFLVDRLMVLKHCFLETLKSIQVEGYLMFIEPSDLFGNVEDICYVSYSFCKEFISDLLSDMSIHSAQFGRTDVLLRNVSKLSNLSRDAGVYHTYCLNYQNALNYLERLRQNNDFVFFEKWCEQDERCQRLQLSDLLVAPVQRTTKLPLLLQAVRHYTYDEVENKQILESIHALNTSLKTLEDKICWLKNYERINEIQRSLRWPSVRDLDHKAFIPDFIRPVLNDSSSHLFASASRSLLHEGPVLLVDATKLHDMHMFLFDDVLMLTRCKRTFQKSVGVETPQKQHQSEVTTYHVHRQPIPLEDLSVYDVLSPEHTVSSMTNALVLIHTSRFEQIISVLTVQTNNLPSKETWLSKIQEAKGKLQFHQRSIISPDTGVQHFPTQLPRKLSNRDTIIPYNNQSNDTTV